LNRSNLLELELLVPILVRGSVGGNREGIGIGKFSAVLLPSGENRGTTFMVPLCDAGML
jgi:hypothetical protein